MTPRISTTWILALILAMATLAARAQPGGGPPAVWVDEVQVQEMSATIIVPGTVVSRFDARVSAEVEGVLVEVADVGTPFDRGEIVARIRNTILELREPELVAEVEREKARLQFLEREVERLDRLAQQNNAARTQLDQTESDRAVAASNVIVAEARLAQVRDQLSRTAQKAPFAGTVVERFRRPGERVNVGTEMVRMVDPNRLEVIARAPLEYLSFLEAGDLIPISVGGRDSSATLRTLAAVGDERTHVFELRADIPGGNLPVGLTVRLTLPASDTRQVVSVPRDALVLRAGGIAVFVVDAGNVARRVEVTTGLASGDRIEVIGDLSPGDRVVVRGNERLQPGETVQIQQSGPVTNGQVASQ